MFDQKDTFKKGLKRRDPSDALIAELDQYRAHLFVFTRVRTLKTPRFNDFLSFAKFL